MILKFCDNCNKIPDNYIELYHDNSPNALYFSKLDAYLWFPKHHIYFCSLSCFYEWVVKQYNNLEAKSNG